MIDDEILMAYVDGELDQERRLEVDRAAASDPGFAARLKAHAALRNAAASAYSEVLTQAPDESLVRLITGSPPSPAAIVDLADVRAKRKSARRPPSGLWEIFARPALAAGIVAPIALAGGFLIRGPVSLVLDRGAGLVASGELARTLDVALQSEQSPTASIRVGLTIRAMDGRYCRVFHVQSSSTSRSGLDGLACRDSTAWRVMLAEATKGGTAATYRTAATETPAPILAEVQALADGPALDAHGEALARRTGWRDNGSKP